MTCKGAHQAVAAGLAVMLVAVAGCGSSDGPQSFLAQDASSAVSVQWKRVGDDVSGSISTTEVTKPETGVFAEPAGEIKQQSEAFTGTVEGDSVRLQAGGALGTRINGRLDGDNLELAIPQDGGVQTVQLKPGDKSDYAKAVQQVRANVKRGKDEAQARRVREQRAARTEIMRVAVAFQKALDPKSSDDPCRYLTPELRRKILALADSKNCTAAIRDSEARYGQPLYEGPQGVAKIEFGSTDQPGASDALVTWRPDRRSSDSQAEAGFTKQEGRWLVSQCCL